MASNRQKTKDSNRFRFKSFSERVNEIDIRRLALYHIGHRNEALSEEEAATFFHQTLTKWSVTNLSEEFTSFSRKCQNIITLPQLIHQKDFVVDLLLEHLSTATALSLQPLLELLYILARDLRDEFYPYFQRVLDRLICLLRTRNAEQLEWTLVCLAHLFKTLKSHLKKNIGVVFHAILPLLDEHCYEAHVTNFAVECFSFIARDVRDFRKFLDFVLDTVAHEQVESVQGCGRLLCEIVRGLKGQFHSVAGEFLQFIFETLTECRKKSGRSEQKSQLLEEIIRRAVSELLGFIQPTNFGLLWMKLCEVAQSINDPIQLPRLLGIFLLAAEHRDGRFLSELDVIVPTILKMFDLVGMENMTDNISPERLQQLKECQRLLGQLVATILLSSSAQLTQLDTSRLLKKTLSIPQRDIYAEFALSIVAHPQFDILVLPAVVAQFEDHYDRTSLELLAGIIQKKSPLVLNSGEQKTWKPYTYLQIKQPQTLKKTVERLKVLKLWSIESSNECEEQMLLLMLAPHLNALDKDIVATSILDVVKKLMAALQLADGNLENDIKEKQRTITFLALLVETHIHLQLKWPRETVRDVANVLLPMINNLYALRALDQLLSSYVQHFKADKEIAIKLSPLLASHDHYMRLNAAQCLRTMFGHMAGQPYGIMCDMEVIEPTIHTYREQLLLLQRLDPSGENFRSIKDNMFREDTLRFLLGLLYHNFKFIWEPVLAMIEEYARNMDVTQFWPIFHDKLLTTAAAIDYTAEEEEDKIWNENDLDVIEAADNNSDVMWHSEILQELLPIPECQPLDKQMLLNYRNLLWMRLPQLGHVAELKNRDVVALFLKFVVEEYRPHFETREYSWNLQLHRSREQHDLEDYDEKTEMDFQEDIEGEEINKNGLENENDNDDEDNTFSDEDEVISERQPHSKTTSPTHQSKKSRRPKKKRKYSKNIKNAGISSAKFILQALQHKLAAFVHHPNPKALHREAELYAIYLDLLASPNPQLQKLALDCVMAYKPKALTPHREILYALTDEKQFKETLIQFNVDETIGSATPKLREEFMHILLRLLYGKMLSRGTQRSGSAQARKALIMRFLGQCSSEEIFWFLRMAFAKFDRYTDTALELRDVVSLVTEEFRLEAVWSARKLLSLINILELIRKEFGGLMDVDFHVYNLKLLMFVGTVCNSVLEADYALMHAKMPSVYRNVRNTALTSLVNQFAHIENFQWQPMQIQCLTEVFIWPAIERLPMESIHTPTPLLKLLLRWGEKDTQHLFLLQSRKGKWIDEKMAEKLSITSQVIDDQDKECNIFSYIITLLLNEKAKMAVRKPIMMMIERLLVSASEKESELIPPKQQQRLEEEEKSSNKSLAKVALALIRPFISDILKRLRMNFSTRSAKKHIDKHDLSILSLLTTHVFEPETCDSLLQLLLPILIARTQSNASEEIICQVITTLSNLIKQLEEPEIYLRKVAPLFEHVQDISARKLLCDLIADIAKRRHKEAQRGMIETKIAERLKETARVILLLNACDRRWVGQPDYDRRLEAIREVRQKIEAGSCIDLDLGVLIIFNCFYYLRYDKDIGLRDNAAEHLQLLLPHLARNCCATDDKRNLDYLVGDVFINLVRRLLTRDAAENARSEGVRLLGVMARECPTTHEILADLAPLSNMVDAEVDFFENLVHLQSHRHGRALLKFCSHAETLLRAPNVRTLTQFVLPLATRYLLAERYATKHTLIDAAIETVGVACQLLPWQHYHAVLRYYLMKMRSSHDYQKQCVRIVMRILDAFHFDLSQARTDEAVWQRLQQEIKQKAALVEGCDETEVSKEEQDELEEKPNKENQINDDDDVDGDEIKDEFHLEMDDEDKEEEEETSLVPFMESEQFVLKRSLILPPNASKRVLATIATILVPTLNRAITAKSSYDMKHKVNRKRLSKEREEEEILRVPIALAMVKLLQKLPKELIETSLPGVFMKVCTFLQSPLKSVRMLTRDILKKIMITLGSSYLPMLVDHLQNLLTRGFQVHVLAVTIHGVLDALRDQLKSDDLQRCLSNLLEVALNDIFGDVNLQKDIDKITAHTPEAKPSAKSFLVLHIAARNIQENCLIDLLMPFKEYLAISHSRKIILKIQDCFAKIVNGLVENPHITRENLLVFIYGTMSESIVDLLPGLQKPILSEKEKEQMRRARPDTLLIPAAPKMRSGAVTKTVKSNAQANAHILIEFGLEMLHIVLKRKKLLDGSVDAYEPFLNPLLPLLGDSLRSMHVRVTTFALKCFASIWNEDYVLSGLTDILDDVVKRMFEILKNFSTFGVGKQEENMSLTRSTFKALVAFLRKCPEYQLSDEQAGQLIMQVDQDLNDEDHQATSFVLLRALLGRKVDIPAIHDTMKQVGDMLVTSLIDNVRNEARALMTIYLMEYTLKKRLDQIIKFFTVQLSYSVPVGRMSVISLLQTLLKKFPVSILRKRAELLYLSLASQLINDHDSDCRRAVAELIELLITRLEKETRQQLFDMTLLFFDSNNKPSVREMAAALCSRFLVAEKQSFKSRLEQTLPLAVERIAQTNLNAPGRFVRAPAAAINLKDMAVVELNNNKRMMKKDRDVTCASTEEAIAEIMKELQRFIDHEIIQMQYCILKMFEYCRSELLSKATLLPMIDELAYASQKLLAHDHAWVRTNAAKIITQIITSYDYDTIGRRLSHVKIEAKLHDKGIKVIKSSSSASKLCYIYNNPEEEIKSLILDLCAQMIPDQTEQPMIDEIVNIFLVIAHILRDVPFNLKKEDREDYMNGDGDKVTKINMNWFLRNIRFVVKKEVDKAPHSITIRSAMFTLIEGLIGLLTVVNLERLTPSILPLLLREMSTEDHNIDPDLRKQALRVGSRLRKRIGNDVYDKLRSQTQMRLMVKRAERKKQLAQEKITDPIRAAKRKASVQERKKIAKKLKTDVMRGKAPDVKQKLVKRRKRKAEDDFF